MNSAGLTAQQAARIAAAIRRRRHYLDCLCGRMQQRWFPANDPLKLAGENALAAMKRLEEVAEGIRDAAKAR